MYKRQVKDRTETEQGTVTQREMLYTYTEGGDILQELGDCTFTVDAGKNNSDNVVIYVQVTDRAGNVSKPEKAAVKINSTSPTIEIKFGKEGEEGEEKPVNVVEENGTERGYYKAARTATAVSYTHLFGGPDAADLGGLQLQWRKHGSPAGQ